MKQLYTVLLILVLLAAAVCLAPYGLTPAAAAQCCCCAGVGKSCSCGCTAKQDAPQDTDFMKAGGCTCAVNEATGNPVMLPESFSPVKNDSPSTINRRFAVQTNLQNGIKILLSLNSSSLSSVPLFLRNSSFLL